jgi:RNA polymerase sigma factor (sigma-70 family)
MFLTKIRRYRQKTDEELLTLYKEKQSKLIVGVLFERYGHLVMGTAMKYLKNELDAEDMTMVIFEELYDKLTKHEISYFKSWLYQVTRNSCLMKLRSEKGTYHVEFDSPFNGLESTDSSGLTKDLSHTISEHKEEAEKAELKEVQYVLIEEALNSLKLEQKECIHLFFMEDKSYHEISEQLGIPLLKVKSAIQNGKRNLRIQLEEKNEFKQDI